MEAVEIAGQAPCKGDAPAPKKPRSGYARIRVRHHALIAVHEELQRSVEGLLKEHHRLMQAVQSVKPGSWAERAMKMLELLEVQPDPVAMQGMAAELDKVHARFSQLMSRMTA